MATQEEEYGEVPLRISLPNARWKEALWWATVPIWGAVLLACLIVIALSWIGLRIRAVYRGILRHNYDNWLDDQW